MLPGTRYLDWDLIDPAGSTIDQVRSIRDLIEDKVVQLLNGLQQKGAAPQP